MNTDEKLQHFQEFTMTDARNESSKILDKYTASLNKMFEEHKEKKLSHAEQLIKDETEGLKRTKNKELSKQHIQIRRNITQKQNEIKDKLFLEVNELLNEYMKTNKYEELLINQINKAKAFAKDNDMTVYISLEDADKKAFLEAETACELTVSEYSFIGGIRAVIREKNILIDNSFESKIAEAKADYAFDGGIKHD